MTIYFIHGFGETPSIFENIETEIIGNKAFIDVWKENVFLDIDTINVKVFADFLVKKYKINNEDIVIGHSMGGWIALYIKQMCNCKIIQLASWTDPRKILVPTLNPAIVYFLFKTNIYINGITQFLFSLLYRNPNSKKMFIDTFQRLHNSPKIEVLKQLRIMFEPVNDATLMPELRVHALHDTVIKYPQESFSVVPGDHFMLHTYPSETLVPILDFFNQYRNPVS